MKGARRSSLWRMVLLGVASLGLVPAPASGGSEGVPALRIAQAEPDTVPAREAGTGMPGSQAISGKEGRRASASPERLFETGNRFYQENDLDAALDAYRGLLEAGYESPDLHYNLGNTYFKMGDLGRSILSWERALRLDPGDSDTLANLELARSLTADEVEPLPRFWLLSALSWWVNLLPRNALTLLLSIGYLLGAGGLCLLILSRGRGRGRLGSWAFLGGLGGAVLFGVTLLARTGVVGGTDWGIILEEAVPVQSAPSAESNLTLFLIHGGSVSAQDRP
ncbi:MAG: tetratricopeptide repeat protein, partial [Longimicrobiales bacterium]